MKPLHRRSVIEQSAELLREALRNGTWSGRLPGVVRLAGEVGVSKLTMRAALRILEDEGLVELAENGYSRFAVPQAESSTKPLRIGIMLPEPLIAQVTHFQQLIIETQHHLEHAGFHPFVFNEDLQSLKHDVRRIKATIAKTPVDACLVVAGSQEVLEWFAAQPLPCMAIFGRGGKLPIARVGPDKGPAMIEALRSLIGLGHTRIVMIGRKERRIPSMGRLERLFLAELETNGIETSSYNMPDWDETPDGFKRLLHELFRVSPPTALFIDEVPLWVAAQQFLALKRIIVPEQISLVAGENDPALFWCSPPITHIQWHIDPIIRRVSRWAKAVSQGREDLKHNLYPAEFVRGGTIGPAPDAAMQTGS